MAANAKGTTTPQQGSEGRSPEEITALLAGAADPEQRLAVHQELYPDVVNLATAENVLVYPSLRDNVFDGLGVLEQKDVKYTPSYGSPEIRHNIAELLRPMLSPDLRSEDVFGTSGTSAALECLAFALRDGGILRSGDRVLLPAPYWQGFNWCFEQRPELVTVPVHLQERGEENFELTLADLQRAYRTQPEPPKLLVLTNPNNPLGDNYSKDLLESIYRWALTETGMHIISDEIYAHSQLAGVEPAFVSALALDTYRNDPQARNRVHVVWGFAKDFGLSGFKAGVVISKSPVVHRTMQGVKDKQTSLSWFSPFDSLKHFVIGTMLETTSDGKSYPLELMKQYRSWLTTAFQETRRALDDGGIPYRYREGQNAAQFLWLDLRAYLPPAGTVIPPEIGPHFPQLDRVPQPFAEKSAEAEKTGTVALPILFPNISSEEEWLRWYVATYAQVQLLPGQLLSCAEPGYFRLCYTAVDTAEVIASVGRIADLLAPWGNGGR
ncbi:aminotransferase class I/II-fold pyridoxal phosphate-dependent enzyme [Streptomyces sp. NRRL B-1347]|uniref:aminotransferase class I/II-fold pyridoxal phosphate-dependent enzyme n=1 Tax=Streptomyces sp. NRRL B-1347 TaxID=1476877 RepID=UPI00068E30B3|nr:aminotransferase class I/II-fold pyridoxal phosphate-dependent enzyme [Streptomyces sp. NRRL B-1347]